MEVPVLMGKSPRNLKTILGLDFPIFHDFSRFLHRNNSLVVAFDLRNEPHDIPGGPKKPAETGKMGISQAPVIVAI